MCKLFDDWSDEIQKYCKSKHFSFEKAQRLSQCWGRDFLALQHHDPEKGKMGLLDETPMPLVLLITETPNGLVFEETEYTRQYLT
ncbi:MAG: hypothetical protein NC084_01760 [Bacteroides sp.]|nr:hypothetical protein [Eubacterium sp.]MCM1417388.1 hypothetical protein [Roseburia sp.]MCM1461420.1 hypothetical protein [Bacteroides sp.]